jgi:peroxiredoxin
LDGIYRDRHAAGLVLVGVGVGSDEHDAATFLKRYRVSFPIALDGSNAVAGRFNQDALPMTVLIDRRGTVRSIHRGYNSGDEHEYDAEINALLKE